MANTTNSDHSLVQEDKERLRRRFWRLSLFNIGSNLTVPITGLVDTAMLGWLPDIRFLAGVALAALIFDYLYFGLGFLRMSTTGETAQAEGRREDSTVVLWRSVALALALAAAILVTQRIIENVAFAVLHGDGGVEQAGRDYYRARIWGAPGAICQMALVGWLLGRERSGSVLAIMTVANLSNVALNWWFIVELNLQAQGAGLASALAQTLGALTAGLLVYRELSDDRPSFRSSLDWTAIKSMMRLNSQIFARTLLLVTCFALFTDASARIGTIVLAANAILLRWVSVLSYLVDGIAYATEALAGRLWGANQRNQLRWFLSYALATGSILSALIWIPMAVFPNLVVNIFTHHEKVVEQAAQLSLWIVPVGVFGALAYVFDGFFLGLTRGAVLLRSMLLSSGVCIALLVLATHLQAPWLLWLGLSALMVLRACTLGLEARKVVVLP